MLRTGERSVLPEPLVPLGHYVAAVHTGALLVVSGMLPLAAGRPLVVGRLGDDVSVEAGRTAARLAALNALAVAERAVGGLHNVRRVVRVAVTMATSPQFTAHAAVADGASELFASLFDEGHTRVATGAYTLPLGAAVIVDVIFEVDQE